MSLSPLVSFKSRFVTYLLNFPRTTFDDGGFDKETGSILNKKFSGRPQPKEILCECSYQLENARTTVHVLLKTTMFYGLETSAGTCSNKQ